LKEHKKVQAHEATITELKSTVAQQQNEMETVIARVEEQAAQIQKVSARSDTNKSARRTGGRIHRGGPAPQVVINP
jgi:methyl-accepting chemotaxis protein